MQKYFPLIAFLTILYLTGKNFYFQKQTWDNQPFGVSANKERMRLGIPQIDAYMIPDNFFNERNLKWKSHQDLPQNDEVLHVWKLVEVPRKIKSYYREVDAFRKKMENEKYLQLNLSSKMVCEGAVKQSGSIFQYNGDHKDILVLKEAELDSILYDWKIIQSMETLSFNSKFK